jgi:hypothetical protein
MTVAQRLLTLEMHASERVTQGHPKCEVNWTVASKAAVPSYC